MASTPALDKMKNLVQARDTDQLFADLQLLDESKVAHKSGFVTYPTESERMVAALISDTIEARHGLEAALDAVFSDIEYAGSYSDALKLAYCAVVK